MAENEPQHVEDKAIRSRLCNAYKGIMQRCAGSTGYQRMGRRENAPRIDADFSAIYGSNFYKFSFDVKTDASII